jgi:phosphatidate cytidylyltransferase
MLTAFIVLSVALLLSVGAMYLPYGRLIVVGFTGAIAVMSTFEVVRLFARDRDTFTYRPAHGVIAFLILAAPSIAAVIEAVSGVVRGAPSYVAVSATTAASAAALMVFLAWCGRYNLDDAAHFSARYAPAFLIVSVCAPQLIVIASTSLAVPLLWWMAGCTAMNDTAAYFTGRSLGKTKMAPALSPNKTVEGSLAGLVAGTVAGALFWYLLLGAEGSMTVVVVSSFAATIAALASDLMKSYLKRLRGVKDTGSFLPGHGGVLDRFDAMIGAAPVAVAALLLLGLL